MSGLVGSGNKKAKTDEEKDLTRIDEDLRPEGLSPFSVDLIRKMIFSHLEDGDLLMARLVAKDWTPLATEECRGRKTIFPWVIGDGEEEDEEAALRFMDVMTPSLPLIPVQQIGLRLDLLLIEPSTVLRLLTFIAPWVKALRLVPWDANNADQSPQGKKAMAWSSALHSHPPLDFPRLEALDLGQAEDDDDDDDKDGSLHQIIALTFVNLITKVVQRARSLQRLSYSVLFFGKGDGFEVEGAELEATKAIMSALPPSLKSLSVGYDCAVDYGALRTLGLNLEEFFCKEKPEPQHEFVEFLEGQKTGLKRLHLLNLDDIYDSHFPKFSFVTELEMMPRQSSTFNCLSSFPALLTLRVDMGRYQTPASGPSEISHLPAHKGVRKLVIRNTRSGFPIPFTLFARALPNLTHVDLAFMDSEDLTSLFTHLPRIVSLKLTVENTRDFEGLQSILSGLHPSLLEMAKDFDILDTEGFHAVEVMGSRRGNSKVGLGNLKDLKVLDISMSPPEGVYEVFLNKLTFWTVFMKMRSLKEIQIDGELPETCEPVLEALRNKGIHVRVYKVKE